VDARAEAFERLGGRYETRVLEPSPPAVGDPPWFADDPVARGEVPSGRRVVSPVGTGDIRWEELARSDEDLQEFCLDRWLGPYRRMEPVPATLVPTRLALHRLAERVISPARRAANGKIGLRYTRGGFGTPFFGADDTQIRVEAHELVVQRAGEERRAPITTLDAAADHVGRSLLPDDVELDDAPLDVDRAASAFLGDWYGFAASVLEELRVGAGKAVDPSRVQLWPEHFDLAVELGREEASSPTGSPARAAYGCSPGDENHDEPYIYVAPWVAPPPGELWQATGFTGAAMSYAELLEAPDQRAAALDFLTARLRALVG
jgi:hypothetical protein